MQRRILAFTAFLGIALVFCASAAMAQYQVTNLVSNQVGQAKHIDPLIVNAWGLVHTPTSPFWISDNGSGWSTLYNGNGAAKSLKVVIPTASGAGPGSPTGIVFNGSQDFQIQGWPAIFLFATLDGTISGWAPQVNANQAFIAVNNSTSGAVYTGLAVTSNASGNFLFAADVVNNKVDMFDGTFNLVMSFTDPTLPAGFAPFGIQDINGLVYVAFASQAGTAGGFIDVFGEDGMFMKQLAQGKPLNQPWGIAIAPKNFGQFSNALLVSNNTNAGTISAFNALTGKLVGTLKDTDGKVIHIDQLWGIEFGGGTANNGQKNQLFFTAGPSNNLAGTFGKIQAK
jgi:uncharacterized protein (TIGR03118 family)